MLHRKIDNHWSAYIRIRVCKVIDAWFWEGASIGLLCVRLKPGYEISKRKVDLCQCRREQSTSASSDSWTYGPRAAQSSAWTSARVRMESQTMMLSSVAVADSVVVANGSELVVAGAVAVSPARVALSGARSWAELFADSELGAGSA